MQYREPRVILFDVIETLLDLRALEPRLAAAFGTADVLKPFFSQMLQSAFALTLSRGYEDFGAVAKAALQITAEQRGVKLTDDAARQVLEGLQTLPPHPEVAAALQRLREAGFRLAALTNSSSAVLHKQVEHAGIAGMFEKLLTVEAVRQFKPAPAVYEYAAKEMGVAVHHTRLVAAHGWDVGGAMRAGCAAAFVARPGQVLDPLFPRPDITGRDLSEVAAAILHADLTPA